MVTGKHTRARTLVGRWRIIQLSELGEDYFEESDEPPFITFHSNKYGTVRGEYHFGLSDGNLDGEIREFGGETVLLFVFEASDEMDEVHGAGWAQLSERDRLEGEFLIDYGRFTATREHRAPHGSRSDPRGNKPGSQARKRPPTRMRKHEPFH